MLTLFPDVTEQNADFAEVECRNDDAECDKMRNCGSRLFLEFTPLEISLGMFLQFGSLHRELEEVIVLVYIGRVIHEQDQEVPRNMYELLGRELELYFFESF